MSFRLAFIGCFSPDIDAESDPRISQAANTYQRKAISSLRPNLTISLLPLILRPLTAPHDRSGSIYLSSDIGLPLRLHRVWRAMADSVRAVITIIQNRTRVVCIYNIDKQNVVVLCALLLLPRMRTILVAADNIGLGVGVWQRFSSFLARKCHGAIVLNSNIHCNRRQVVSPGLIRREEVRTRNQSVGRRVLLSGSLGSTTGLDLAIDAFADTPDFELLISGRPFRCTETDLRNRIDRAAKKHGNIHYYGLMTKREYGRIMNSCDMALSLRNPDEDEHRFNFPSKILEYLADSMFVISTLQYREVPKGILFHCPYNPSGLRRAIQDIHSMAPSETIKHRRKASAFLHAQVTLESFRKNFGILAHA